MLFYYFCQRLGALRGSGFLALPLIRSRKPKFTKKFQTKHLTRYLAKPLLVAVAIGRPLFIRLCIGWKLKNRGKEIFYQVGKASSLRIFCRLCAIAKIRNVLACMLGLLQMLFKECSQFVKRYFSYNIVRSRKQENIWLTPKLIVYFNIFAFKIIQNFMYFSKPW